MAVIPEVDTACLLKLSSFVFWSCLYVLSNVKILDKSPEYHSRVVTLLHGSVAFVVGFVQCGVGSLSMCRLTSDLLPQHYALMVWSWGYFAFDLLWCLLYWTHDKLMLAHHFCTLVAITVYMHKDGTGCSFACTMSYMEITNPLLQIRWFMKDGGLGATKTYYVIETVYLSSFILLRGVLGTYIVYQIMWSDVFIIETKMIALSLYLVSLGLIWQILSYVQYKYKTHIVSNLLALFILEKLPVPLVSEFLCSHIREKI